MVAIASHIVVDDVWKSFGGIQAVRGLSLDIDQRHITGLIGPNGAGKTTVFNLITGVLKPDRGSITLDGQQLSGRSPDSIVHLGVARSFQDLRLFSRMSTLDNVLVAQPWKGNYVQQLVRPARQVGVDVEAARALLERVGLGGYDALPAGGLTYAQQKTLAIARLLATGARFLLLDEPMSGLDDAAVSSMLALLGTLADQGVGLCVVEHNMEVIRRLCTRVAFLANGQCLAVGEPGEIMARDDLAELFFGRPPNG